MQPKQQGFTLVELMVTIAVLAIVVGIAVPSFYTQIQNNRSLALAEDFAGALNYARSEAVKRGTRVSLCASADGKKCGGDWKQSWIAFVDSATSDDSAAPVIENGEAVLQRWQVPNGKASLTVTQGGKSAGFIRYNRLGILGRAGGGDISATLSYRGCAGNTARTITVGPAGMVSVARTNCSKEK
ncbi:GspH/FimT family pseudopilin [Microbulbifer rhizosphaerae]|uniref:Type II secretion system protein H n=1 Tax=Microbulbifer rhizosphaerae TaxID=1562603 RepID=A0A7W4WDV2_9GAMM|nr:GspH/FimT family pseudopilin [Microbulbifer rhizosphaerae]MBB3062419.1 type IV fimbrial biogenesis protein FimT [Microbulbifer rhizosphaerae]